jgi:vacuolar-type H+-ATPase subunit E/Vma4
MGLDEITGQIGKESSARVKEIIEQAQADALRMKDQADEEAAQYLRERKDEADREAKLVLARELSKARAEAKELYRKEIGSIIDGSFSKLDDGMQQYVLSEDYAALLPKLANIAVKELGAGCIIYLNKRDMKRVKLPDVQAKELKGEHIGGLSGVSQNGKLSVDFTIGRIIETLRDGIAGQVLSYAEGGKKAKAPGVES